MRSTRKAYRQTTPFPLSRGMNVSVVLMLAAVACSMGAGKKKEEPTMMRAYMQNLYDAVPFSIDAVATKAQWQAWRTRTMTDLRATLGLEQFPKRTPLNVREGVTLDRQGYTVQMIRFETRPNFLMAANLYRPKGLKGRAPGILCVHGHTMAGKAAQSVQTRCINFVRAGWVVLAVDATGHGERQHIGHRRTFAIVTTGMTLEGVQVWDNMRCVDYLLSRPDVDPKRIVMTGASGGGNQTMYTAAIDDRIALAAPVASVSTLRGQIFTNNGIGCQCECIPNLMRTGLENAVVSGLIAPRPLLQVNDKRDPVFPYKYAGEASKHIARFYEAVGCGDRYELATISARRNWHGYHGLARGAAQRWLDRRLNNLDAPRPFREKTPVLELDQDLFCFPAGRLPADSETLGTLAYDLAASQVKKLRVPKTNAAKAKLRGRIRDDVLGGFPPPCPLDARETAPVTREGVTRWGVTLAPEPGITITARLRRKADADGPGPCVVVVRPKPTPRYWEHSQAWLDQGYIVAELDTRPLGGDEHVSRAALVFGRPLVGMGAYDITRFVDYLADRDGIDPDRIVLWADDLMALAALYALALDTRIAGGTLTGLLTTYVSPTPVQHPTWTFASGLLKHADIEHLAALVAPRDLTIAGPVGPDLRPVPKRRLPRVFAVTRRAYAGTRTLRITAGR